jgi:hypothetical protein
MKRTSFPDELALQGLLKKLSAEMLVLASAAIAIEDKVGDVIAQGIPGAERLLVPLQGLDHLAQTANDLASFIADVSNSVDPHTSISVSEHIHSVRLRSLAEALVGHSSGTSGPAAGMGDVDLF